MTNNNVQEDRSMSTITRDAPPIIEVKRNSCQQLHIWVQPISHSCTYTPQSSTKSTTTWLQVFQSSSKNSASCMVHKMSTSTTKRALIYRMARWAWSRTSLIQSVRTTLDAQWWHTVIHWMDSVSTPTWAESTHTIVSLRQSSQHHLQNYNHVSFLQPHKWHESHIHMKLVYNKEDWRNEQGELVQDEHVDHAVWMHTVWSWVR